MALLTCVQSSRKMSDSEPVSGVVGLTSYTAAATSAAGNDSTGVISLVEEATSD